MFPWWALTSTSLLNLFSIGRHNQKRGLATRAKPHTRATTIFEKIPKDRLGCNFSLALADVFATKQKLPVQVTDVDCIEIHDFDLFET